jgi:hypothetical protein
LDVRLNSCTGIRFFLEVKQVLDYCGGSREPQYAYPQPITRRKCGFALGHEQLL